MEGQGDYDSSGGHSHRSDSRMKAFYKEGSGEPFLECNSAKKVAPPKKASTPNRETNKTGLCEILATPAFDVGELHRKEY